jgi:hypothetical protein
MNVHSESDFLAWAQQRGLVIDPRYPGSASLTFVPDRQFSRLWVVPSEPQLRPQFLLFMLDAFGTWDSYRCWKHLGSWPAESDQESINDQIEHSIFRGIGLPEGTSHIVEFDYSERVPLITLLLATTIFGFAAGDDLFLVPDTARGILQTDHHGAIHAAFREEAPMSEFIRGMERKGYSLPDDVPDETFKFPKWMRNQ